MNYIQLDADLVEHYDGFGTLDDLVDSDLQQERREREGDDVLLVGEDDCW